MRHRRLLVGRNVEIVERFVISWVWRQFVELQVVSMEMATYAHFHLDELRGWLHMLYY